jgi:pseudoazurin
MRGIGGSFGIRDPERGNEEAALKVEVWPSVIPWKVLTCVLTVFLQPVAVLAEEHEVHSISHRNYESMFFDPHFLKAEPGDSVAFVVTDFDHQPQSVLVPDGVDHWQAEKGKSITVRLDREGIYIFDCSYHNVMGMAGVIMVGSPVNLEEARLFFEQYKKKTFAMNKDRLDPVWDPDNQLLVDQATGK